MPKTVLIKYCLDFHFNQGLLKNNYIID